MPIYAYRCEACGHERDVLQKVSDAPLTVCPACGEPALRKQLTAAGFQLKGSGWYVTDFRDKGRGKPAAKPGEAAGAGEAGKAGDAAAAPGPAAASGAAGSDSAASGAAASGAAASGAPGTKAAAAPAGASPAAAKPD